ncbi:MAG: dynamin family protein [Ilumatobacteraceae bacterium]
MSPRPAADTPPTPPPPVFAPPSPGTRSPTLPAPEPSAVPLAAAIEIAERSGQTDLAGLLRVNREHIRRTTVTVAVVGEFKKGKSSLVNALVNAEVCPSDPVDATVVPIAVGHGTELGVTIERQVEPPIHGDLAQVATYGSEAGNEANHLGVTRIEIGLPRELLASGLMIIDTPGVGGLESAAGAMNLATLEEVDGVLFVTDCSQELTGPEVAYLAAARARCPAVVCVMSKLDLYLAAPILAEHNRDHLRAAGLEDVAVIPVSSVLHLVGDARGDAQLRRESGFAALFDALRTVIWEPARARGLAVAGEELAGLANHLAIPIDAAAMATGSEAAARQTIARLGEARDRVRQFRSASARWQQRLADGMQQASVDLDRDLQARLRSLSEMIDDRVDTERPAEDLVLEAWVHKSTIERIVGHYELLAARATELVDEIDQHFATLDGPAAFQVQTAVPTELLTAVHVNGGQRLLKDGVARRLATSGQGYGSGLVLLSSVVGVVSVLPWIPLLALPFAGLMATRGFSGDRDRRRAARDEEMKGLATRYVDEVGTIVRQDAGDTLGRLHRDIREHYARRAELLESTLQRALVSAEAARGPVPDEREPARSEEHTTVRDVFSLAQRLVAGAAIAP